MTVFKQCYVVIGGSAGSQHCMGDGSDAPGGKEQIKTSIFKGRAVDMCKRHTAILIDEQRVDVRDAPR